MAQPPCAKNPNLWTDPQPETSEDAIQVCRSCPLLESCATEALQAGTTLDGQHRAPATDVIQAGVWCKGDQDTATQLATIAGIPTPKNRVRRRTQPTPTTCKGCGRPMVARSNHSVPTSAGVMTHAAHGYCRVCDARRRRQPGWVATMPKHQTALGGWERTHRPKGLTCKGTTA